MDIFFLICSFKESGNIRCIIFYHLLRLRQLNVINLESISSCHDSHVRQH